MHELGLDQPVYVQYLQWLGRFVQGDWGVSFISRDNIFKQAVRISKVFRPCTGRLVGASAPTATLLSSTGRAELPLGFPEASRQRRPTTSVTLPARGAAARRRDARRAR